MEPILTLETVSYRYEDTWAIQGIRLEIGARELVGILGPNGSGKSTLLKIMGGLLKPESGSVLYAGRPVAALKRRELAQKIAFVAQEHSFRFSFSVLEVVLMGRSPHLKRLQFESERDLEIALQALRTVDAERLATRSIHELSGGEKQRVLIARALAQDPEIILLDEPTAFLDIKYKMEIFELISSLVRDKHVSVVAVTHDIDLAALYCNRLVILENGRLFSAGTPAEVVTSEGISAAYDCRVLVDTNPATGAPRVSLVGRAGCRTGSPACVEAPSTAS
ncbi:ABC-type cobalamin/Fe3+-siderophore transport system, ATPase component [uncultured Desulfatiglans sp.]|uniref:ABC-type cobalamin/Fe3+-siderophore transport system, ATPase component n=1 Tax=Uncultured Desulfatiglans sp. TaxID=1748965 RepID=A0A653ABF1_UNCDX|nr:ABC-type cobalamin/Fe3+-siderophore transport system, ATPase component [uncultured Desulfatiglans sp.]